MVILKNRVLHAGGLARQNTQLEGLFCPLVILLIFLVGAAAIRFLVKWIAEETNNE